MPLGGINKFMPFGLNHGKNGEPFLPPGLIKLPTLIHIHQSGPKIQKVENVLLHKIAPVQYLMGSYPTKNLIVLSRFRGGSKIHILPIAIPYLRLALIGVNFLLSNFKLLIWLGVGKDEATLNTKCQLDRITVYLLSAIVLNVCLMTHLAKFRGHGATSKYYPIWLKLRIQSFLIHTNSQPNEQFEIRKQKIHTYV